MHTPDTLLDFLTSHHIAYHHLSHPAVMTAHENPLDDNGRPLLASIPGLPVRNLFLRDKSPPATRRYWLVTLPLLAPSVDLKTLKILLSPATPVSGNLSFASPEELLQHLGVTPGSVCPFAALNDTAHHVHIVLDESLVTAALVSAHPLINTATISMSSADLLRFFSLTGHQPQVLPLPWRQACPPEKTMA